MANSIHHRFFYPHQPATVWEYLTKSDLMAQWLMANDFQPFVGYDFQFKVNPIPKLNFDGIIYCKVLEIVPNKKLSYSWKSGPGNGKITLDSIVVWELHPKDNGTELIINHTGISLPENLSIYEAMNEGWLKNIQKIAALINLAKHDNPNA
jgi:uncharacterized protein YndB with AHSA1/START domain